MTRREEESAEASHRGDLRDGSRETSDRDDVRDGPSDTTAPAPAKARQGRRSNAVVRFFRMLGPGFVTGSADNDPSGVATYAQSGAAYSNALLWTVPATLPMMIAAQEIIDRTAITTGDSLGALIRRRFGRRARIAIGVLMVALIAANTFNLAADLMAIGAGMQLLNAGPGALWTTIAGIAIALTVVAGSFAVVARIFKWLCLVLLVYVGVLFTAHVDWSDVATGLLGMQFAWTPTYLGLAVAVLGTTVSPYMFFWASAQRVEEMRQEDLGGDEAPPITARPKRERDRRLRNGRIDVVSGMVFSVVIMFAIIAATAATLGAEGKVVESAADAAAALEPIAGSAASTLFAIGFIGTGVLAVPILAASGAAGMAGLLHKRWGFDERVRNAPLFYSLIGVGIIGGIILGFISSNPIDLLVLSAILNGIAAGPFLIVIMLISSSREIMGEHRNGRVALVFGWGTTAVMCVAGAYGVWFTLSGGG